MQIYKMQKIIWDIYNIIKRYNICKIKVSEREKKNSSEVIHEEK